jgi:hypothetical protein
MLHRKEKRPVCLEEKPDTFSERIADFRGDSLSAPKITVRIFLHVEGVRQAPP